MGKAIGDQVKNTRAIEEIPLSLVPSFLDGFYSGYNWPDGEFHNYRPGGPYIGHREWDKKINRIYMLGWDKGKALKIKEGKKGSSFAEQNQITDKLLTAEIDNFLAAVEKYLDKAIIE